MPSLLLGGVMLATATAQTDPGALDTDFSQERKLPALKNPTITPG